MPRELLKQAKTIKGQASADKNLHDLVSSKLMAFYWQWEKSYLLGYNQKRLKLGILALE